jgi:hypothetical protein
MKNNIADIVNDLETKGKAGTLTVADINVPIHCFVCNREMPTLRSLYAHIVNMSDEEHKTFRKDNKDYMVKLRNRFTEIEKKQKEINTEGTNMNKDPEPPATQAPAKETPSSPTLPDVYDELKNILIAVLGPKHPKIDGLIWLFQRQTDYTDVKALNEMLGLAGISPAHRKMIVQQWATYMGVEDADVDTLSDQSAEKKELEKKEADTIKDFIQDTKETIKQRIKDEIEMRQLITQASQFGIDVSEMGLPNVTLPKKQQLDEDPIDEFEFPPNSGKFVKIRTSTYMKNMTQWYAIHNKKEEKEDTVPWENPYTHTIINVPRPQLSQYLAITQKYEELQKANDKKEEKEETVPWENPYTHEIINVPKPQYAHYMAITQRYEELQKANDKKEEKEETVPWENPYDHTIIEVPKSRVPQYLAITQRFAETSHTAKNENIERVPWEDPVTKKVIEVPMDKLHYYMNISANHDKTAGQSEFELKLEQIRKENADRMNEIKNSYEKILESSKKEAEELAKKLDEKEKEKLYGYIGSLQDKLEKLEKKDDLQEVSQKYDEISKFLGKLGYATQTQNVKDLAEVNKIRVQADAIDKGMGVVVEQAKQFGVPVRQLLSSLGPLVQDEARMLLQQRRARQVAEGGMAMTGQEIPYSEQDLVELEKKLDAAGKMQEQAKPPNTNNISMPPVIPLPSTKPVENNQKSKTIIVSTEEYKKAEQNTKNTNTGNAMNSDKGEQ